MKAKLSTTLGLITTLVLSPLAHAKYGLEAPICKVYCGNELCLTLSVTAGGLTAPERQIECQQRLIDIMSNGDYSFRVIAPASCPSARSIYIGRRLAVTVTQADAQVNNSTVDGLAALWTTKLLNGIYVATGQNH